MADVLVEFEVLDGLAPFVLDEVRSLRPPVEMVSHDETAVRVRCSPQVVVAMDDLRTAVAAHLLLAFDVPRPKALLGDENLRRIVFAIDDVQARHPFTGFRLSAAGRDSNVYARLTNALAPRTGLQHDPDDGDLLVRVRPARTQPTGWEVLIRTTPRPLATRRWRVQNFRGGLNATIAAALVELSDPTPKDRVFNPMCGAGTLIIERLARGPVASIAGCDTDADALAATRANLGGARMRTRVELWPDDATALARIDAPRFDRVLVDLPWGTLVGSHSDNATLYPTFLAELARVTSPDARAVVLTHEVRLFERVTADLADWHTESALRLFQKGHHPRAYVLTRVS